MRTSVEVVEDAAKVVDARKLSTAEIGYGGS